jgi:hypothetical protein
MEQDPYTAPAASLEGYGHAGSNEVVAVVIDQLARTKVWVRLISILIYIGAAFLVLAGIFMGIGGGAAMMASREGANFGVGFGIGMMLVYVLIALVYIYPAMKLWAYATRIAALVRDRNTLSLEQALNEQRKFWKFCGVVAILFLGFYAVIAVVAIIGVAVGAAASSAGGTP